MSVNYIKIPGDRSARIAAGEAIMRLSRTAFQSGPAGTETEWQQFEKDPAAWLHKHGYRFVGPDAPPDGTVPPSVLRIQPVFDTPHVMHVRVPWIGNIDPTVPLPDGSEYVGSFPAFLSTYFTRHCR